MVKLGLTEHGFQVEVAYDGAIAFKIFSARPFNLIILDINLPGMNGYDLCKAMRAVNNNIPVIMLTSMSDMNDKVEGYESGADDYLVKPFEFRELLLKIRVLLKRSLQEQLFEVHRRQQKRWEATFGQQIGDDLSRVRQQIVGAENANQALSVLGRDVAHSERAGLLQLYQPNSLFRSLRFDAHREHDFLHVVA